MTTRAKNLAVGFILILMAFFFITWTVVTVSDFNEKQDTTVRNNQLANDCTAYVKTHADPLRNDGDRIVYCVRVGGVDPKTGFSIYDSEPVTPKSADQIACEADGGEWIPGTSSAANCFPK